ncbi:MAG: hypothetical protein K9W44_05830 [Candidatus Lokiarchaeota archaeon]|nr:hypothetical protein [Candidatus Harpocratesius repetitus]
MVIIKSKYYYIKPSDSKNWLIIGSPSNKEVDVEIKILDYLFRCEPKEIEVDGMQIMCSRLCCYTGCYVSMEEIKRAEVLLPKIFPDLQEDAKNLLNINNNQIYLPDDYDREENLYKIRCSPNEWNFNEDDDEEEDDEFSLPPRNHCIFLMKNGLCALHKYYIKYNQNWIKEKFNICTTFPLDLRPQDGTMGFMNEFDDFAFGEVECLSKNRNLKEHLGYPQIIDSMKDVIVDRFGISWWNALNHCAKDFRLGKIDIDYIYSDTNLA